MADRNIISSWRVRATFERAHPSHPDEKEASTMEFTFSGTADWVVGVLLFGVPIAGFVVSVS